jgi:hypothetical protein
VNGNFIYLEQKTEEETDLEGLWVGENYVEQIKNSLL